MLALRHSFLNTTLVRHQIASARYSRQLGARSARLHCSYLLQLLLTPLQCLDVVARVPKGHLCSSTKSEYAMHTR
jgi:hypothetical protein